MENNTSLKEKFKQQFDQKLNTIRQEILTKGYSKVSQDYFYISVEDGKVYGYTRFKMISLLDIFSSDLKDFLKKNNISLKKSSNKLFFSKNFLGTLKK